VLQEAVINVPCVSADGKLTQSGLATLAALKSGTAIPEAVSKITGIPLFRIRSGLRELVTAGFVTEVNDKFQLSDGGKKLVP
jgi:predicted transcriptional regulator